MKKAERENFRNLHSIFYKSFEDICNNNLDGIYYATKLLKIAIKIAKDKELDAKEESFLEKIGAYEPYLQIKRANVSNRFEKEAIVSYIWNWLKSLTPVGTLLSGAIGVVAMALFLYPLLAAASTGFLSGLGIGYMKPEGRPEADSIKEFVSNRLQAHQIRMLNETLKRSRDTKNKLKELEGDLDYE